MGVELEIMTTAGPKQINKLARIWQLPLLSEPDTDADRLKGETPAGQHLAGHYTKISFVKQIADTVTRIAVHSICNSGIWRLDDTDRRHIAACKFRCCCIYVCILYAVCAKVGIH